MTNQCAAVSNKNDSVIMSTLHKVAFVIVAALCMLVGASSAQASLCVPAPFEGDWVVSGNLPAYPGQQNAYYLGAMRIGMRCTNENTGGCSGEGANKVCSNASGVKPVYTIGVGESQPSFTGPAELAYWPATDAVDGTEGWRVATATINGNLTKTWFRVQADGNLQGVFEVWINGQYKGAEWRTFVRPRPIAIRIEPRRPFPGF